MGPASVSINKMIAQKPASPVKIRRNPPGIQQTDKPVMEKKMVKITNPILRGFHPDPSLLRVGEHFYIAVSTFEWFPGVQIYHSVDLVNWDLTARPLERTSQLDMVGNPSSGGIWAPCLSYDKGTFYLIYTNSKLWAGSSIDSNGFKDTHNYLVTADSITGPWSEPVYLKSSGFDPSLFHDDNGQKWLTHALWDYRPGNNPFAGIVLQEFDGEKKQLVGPEEIIFTGTDIKLTEGPHLYKRNGWYYLLTAEGGTEYEHAVTFARSPSINGPYEVHPANPIMTSVRDRKGLDAEQDRNKIQNHLHRGLQKAGHASICEWNKNEWIMAHLCGRPVKGTNCCPLGRETALQKMVWKEDGWLYPVSDKPEITVTFSGPDLEKSINNSSETGFDKEKLGPEFQFSRCPPGNSLSLTERKGWLRLYGRDSIISPFTQSLVARRVQSLNCYIETCMEFSPRHFLQMAGLLLKYDEKNQWYLRMSYDEKLKENTLGLLVYEHFAFSMPLEKEVIIRGSRVYLAVKIEEQKTRFYYSTDKKKWEQIGPGLDTYKLSDDYVEPLGFTGLFAGLACQDMNNRSIYADFDYFLYKEETV